MMESKEMQIQTVEENKQEPKQPEPTKELLKIEEPEPKQEED